MFIWGLESQIANLNLNLNSLLVARQMTLFHQGVRMGGGISPLKMPGCEHVQVAKVLVANG